MNNLITTKKIEFVVIFFTSLQHFFLHRQLADLTPSTFPFSPVSLPLGATTRHSFGQQVTRRNLLGNLPENFSFLNKKAQTQWVSHFALTLCSFALLSASCLECKCDAWRHSSHLLTIRQRAIRANAIKQSMVRQKRARKSLCLGCVIMWWHQPWSSFS